MDGAPVPLNGSDPRFNVELEGSVQAGCIQMCEGNPCGAKSSCIPVGEEISCIALSDVDSEHLTVGVIVVIVFFGVLLITVIIIFVIFRVRQQLCFKKKPSDNYKESGMKSVNNSNNSHQDSGYGDTGEQTDEIFIQNHVAQQMSKYPGQNGNLVRPDIIGSDQNGRSAMPLEIDDGTVIIENGDILHSINNDIPERYDIDTASSIAPSDIDVHEHYRHFRDGRGQKFDKMSHYKRQHYTPQNPGIRESPVSTSSRGRTPIVLTDSPSIARKHNVTQNDSSPCTDRHLSSNRTHLKTSPKSLAARKGRNNHQSSNLKHSAFLPMNMYGSDYTRSGGRSNSDHSTSSYHSHISGLQDTHIIPRGAIHSECNTGAHSKHKTMDPYKKYQGGLTVEQVQRLNTHPQHAGQGSFLDLVSSSSNEHHIQQRNCSSHQDNSILLEAPDSTSEDSANDSFTCSEFEQDNPVYDKAWGDLDPGAMLFSKLAKVDNGANHNRINNPRMYHDGLNSKGNSFNSNSEEEPSLPPKLPNGQFNWDYLLNWGPSFERLVGVFKDIASLPDGESSGTIEDGALTNQEEYV